MKNILFLNFNCYLCPHFDTELEIMKNLMDEGNNVYSCFCDKNIINTFCISYPSEKNNYHCRKCESVLKRGLDLINIPSENRIQIKSVDHDDFPTFKNIEELKAFSLNGIKIGFGVANSFMSITRDYKFDTVVNKDRIKGYLNTIYTILCNVDSVVKEKHIDEVYMFNGRFFEYWGVLELCKHKGIDYYLHERGANKYKYELIKNNSFHEIVSLKKRVNFYWEKGFENKNDTAVKWFEDRRSGKDQAWLSFTKNQNRGLLPKNFDKNKENIAIFNSSLDEYYAFDDWKNPVSENENEIILNIIEKFKYEEKKHFYLRIHPNLLTANTKQMHELKNIVNKNFKNFTVIYPDEKIDSYFLLLNVSKIIVFGSTIGVESCYFGTPAILAGRAIYEDLDCCYTANNFNELYELIDKDLAPKQKENSYPYGYWQSVFGIEFKYFKPHNLFEGTFMGENIRIRNKFLHKLSWFIPVRKWRDNFRNRFI